MPKPIFLLIDAHAIIHRAYHAFPPDLKTRTGVQINAAYGFTKILIEVVELFKPTYLVCAFDESGPTQRHDLYVDYKINRKRPDDELIAQIPIIREIVQTLGIPIFSQKGFEADDIIGTITAESAETYKYIVVTGDQDIFQLIEDDKTEVYISSGGNRFAKSKLYDSQGVVEKFGFGPEYIVDYKSLRGDTSDNIPGVAGIGEKTATDLIKQFGHLDQIYQNLANIKSKSVRQKLENDFEMAQLSRNLATIIRDVPLSLQLDQAKFAHNADLASIKEKFVELGFRSLIAKTSLFASEGAKPEDVYSDQPSLFATNSPRPQVRVPSTSAYTIIRDDKTFDKFIKELETQPEFAFDTETTGLNIMTAKAIGISVSWQVGEGFYLDLRSYTPDLDRISKLKNIFTNPKIRKIAHNIKFDVHILQNPGWKCDLEFDTQNLHFDTMVAAYVLNGGGGKYGLKRLAFDELGFDMVELDEIWKTAPGFKLKKNYTPEEIEKYMTTCDPDMLGHYACADADATWRLYQHYSSKFEDSTPKSQFLFQNIEMTLIPVLIEMEREGIELDADYLQNYGRELDQAIQLTQKEIFASVGHEFNIASPKQVGEVLFEELGLPGGKKTKTGSWQTNERILLNLRTVSPVVEHLMTFRELTKIRSTYIDSLTNQINPSTKRIHTSYNQTIASTGRLSSVNPNLQNIPVATEVGRKIRTGFVASPGRVLVAFDISQQELRILAHMSGEPNLIQAYKEQKDVHTITASKLFKIPESEVTKEQRAKGKTLNFSLIYGISAFGLADRLKIPWEEAQSLIDTYFAIYPKVKEFFDQLLADAKAKGRVETMFGRYRETSGLTSSNFAIRSATEREVINFPIQGTAADMVKLAMIDCHTYLHSSDIPADLDAKMHLQVHDELIFSFEHSALQKSQKTFQEEIIKRMQNAVKLDVPIVVGCNTAQNWGELK